MLCRKMLLVLISSNNSISSDIKFILYIDAHLIFLRYMQGRGNTKRHTMANTEEVHSLQSTAASTGRTRRTGLLTVTERPGKVLFMYAFVLFCIPRHKESDYKGIVFLCSLLYVFLYYLTIFCLFSINLLPNITMSFVKLIHIWYPIDKRKLDSVYKLRFLLMNFFKTKCKTSILSFLKKCVKNSSEIWIQI